ncbi:CASP 5A1 [Olea europaea subsp. europaea]|uniref:CASP-like protein n=2 Tax=Olea europaea subsp. europaea TaxID=158383 RepID=A0A8S0RYE0_OLEEU|nr:CASP 5A1 [Olea europaea subsp. europaea]
MSRPAVHPVDAPPMTFEAPRVRMKDVHGMPGTIGGLFLRLCQFVFAVVSLCVMTTTSDFPSVTAFRYLVAAVGLQSFWSLSLALADIYALSVRRRFRHVGVVSLFAIGDGVTSTLTFAAACASAGITVLIGNDMDKCNVNHCTKFMSATAMAFLSWFATSPSFILNFWSLASRSAKVV